ncbi:hypothetical protein [Candidatus Poriferisocius sp.]|uniref:hypothetical protein n=1 Tax=Candidatus Poriferisocius sp. TaxID=3101276 RepID=UPI003B5BAA9D
MEQAILAMLGIIITLVLYLDRGRRSDIALLRADNAKLRDDMTEGFKEVRAEARSDNTKLRDDMTEGFREVNTRLDKLTGVVMDLCHRVGRLEGRAEVSEPGPDSSQ